MMTNFWMSRRILGSLVVLLFYRRLVLYGLLLKYLVWRLEKKANTTVYTNDLLTVVL